MPSVTVVIPNYNHAPYLERRIRSVLEQSRPPDEVLVLDDASTDASLTVINRFRDRPGLRVVANAVNSGSPFAQWNRGVELARGDLVWIAESDDDAHPDLLATLVPRLADDPGAVLAWCRSRTIDERGRPTGLADRFFEHLEPGRWRRDFRVAGREELERTLRRANTIPNASAVVFRRSAYLDAGGADPTMRMCGDWLAWSRLCLRGDLHHVAAPLNDFRLHPDSACNRVDFRRSAAESAAVRRFIASARRGRARAAGPRPEGREVWSRGGLLAGALHGPSRAATASPEPAGFGAPVLAPGPAYDVVIPLDDRGEHLAAVVAAVREQTAPPGRLLAVGAGPALEVARALGLATVAAPPGRPSQTGRWLNAGLERCEADWVLCLAPTARLADRGVVAELLAGATGAPGIVAATATAHPGDAAPHPRERLARSAGAPAERALLGLAPACALVRRTAWRACPFPEAVATGFDAAWLAAPALAGSVVRLEGRDVRDLDPGRSRWSHLAEYRALARLGAPGLRSWSAIASDLREGLRAARVSGRLRGHWRLQRGVALALDRVGPRILDPDPPRDGRPPRWLGPLF